MKRAVLRPSARAKNPKPKKHILNEAQRAHLESLRMTAEATSGEITVKPLVRSSKYASSKDESRFGGPRKWRGRPKKKDEPRANMYNPNIHPFQVYRMRLVGLSLQRIADILLVDPKTILNWREKHSEFHDAWEEGGDQADAVVAQSIFRRAVGYEHAAEKIAINAQTGDVIRAPYTERFAPDTAAGIFWLTNRQGHMWKQKNNTELTGRDGQPLSAPSILINPVMSANQLAPVIDGEAEELDDEPQEEEEPSGGSTDIDGDNQS